MLTSTVASLRGEPIENDESFSNDESNEIAEAISNAEANNVGEPP